MTKNTEDALKKLINKSKAKIANNRDDMVDTMVKNTMADLKRDRRRASWMSLGGNKEKSETGIQKVFHNSDGQVWFWISESDYDNIFGTPAPKKLAPGVSDVEGLVLGDILYTSPDGKKTLGSIRFWNMNAHDGAVKAAFPDPGICGRWHELEYLIPDSHFKEGGTLYKAGKNGDWKTYPPLDGMECAVSHGGNDAHNGRYVCGQSAPGCVGLVPNETWGKCAPGPPPDRAAAEGEACNFHHASLHAHGEGKPIYQVCGAEAPRCDMWGNQTSGRCVKIETIEQYHPDKQVIHTRKKDDLTKYMCPEGMLGPGCQNNAGGVASRNGTHDQCKIGYYLYCYPDNNPPETQRSYSSYYPDEGQPTTNHFQKSMLDSETCWAALTNDLNQWIEVYLGVPRAVHRVVTQGRADAGQWVTKYKVQYKEKEEDSWTDVKNIQGSYIFIGNRSWGKEKVSNQLEVPIFASYIKIIPVAWYSHISMRVGFDHAVPKGKEGIVAYDGDENEEDSEYTKTMSATASTLQEWASNVVKKTVASDNASEKCSDPPPPQSDRVCANGKEGESEFNSCTAKHEMWTDLKTNPILRHFVDAWSKEEKTPLNTLKFLGSPKLANNQMGIGWLQIPTTDTNLLRGNWGSSPGQDGHSNFVPKDKTVDYSIDGSKKLTMLIVRKFSSDESKAIYDALQNQTSGPSPPRDSKIVAGHNFVFTKEGHISFIPPGKTSNDQVTYLNPFINPEHDNIAPESGGKKNTLSGTASDPLHIEPRQLNTLQGASEDASGNSIGKFSGFLQSKKGVELVYAMGPKTVMNRALTYILYTPASEDYLIDTPAGKVDNAKALEVIGRSRYYLLYNPLHTLEFRRFFQSHLQVKASGSSPPDTDLYYKVPSNIATPYAAGSVKVEDPTGCRDPIQVPAYATTIARYCNAFQITGLRNASGYHDIKHYADPTCPFAMGTYSSNFAFATNSNVTQQSIREDYYRLKRTSTPYSSLQVGNDRISRLEVEEPYISLSWACEGHTPDKNSSIMGWMKQSGMLDYNSTSFMKDIVNSTINTSEHKELGMEASIQRIPSTTQNEDGSIRPMTAKELDEYLKPTSQGRHKWGLSKCVQTDKKITLCSTTVNVAGNIVNSNTTQSNLCGGVPPEEETKDPDEDPDNKEDISPPDNPDEAVLDCQRLPKVPECGKFGVPGDYAVEKEIDGKIIYTACCMHSNGTDMIDCPIKENGSCEPVNANLTEQPPEETGTIEGGGDAGSTVSVADLSERIDKAMNVAVTSKNAYPDDLNVIDKAEAILTESRRLQTDASKLQEDLEALDVTGNRTTFNTDLGNLADDVAELERLERELVKLISDNYLFGQKKMYVFGAIGLIVLILFLLFFMSGRRSYPMPRMYPGARY